MCVEMRSKSSKEEEKKGDENLEMKEMPRRTELSF